MDPRTILAASQQLAVENPGLQGKSAEQLTAITTNLLNAGLMRPQSGPQGGFTIDSQSPRMIHVCPELVTNDALWQLSQSHEAGNIASAELSRRLAANPDVARHNTTHLSTGVPSGVALSADDQAELDRYITESAPMRGAATPENLVGADRLMTGQEVLDNIVRLSTPHARRVADRDKRVSDVIDTALTNFQRGGNDAA